ncbi:BACON domain-containing protein [Streptomyces sp. NPDC054841]
MTSSMLEPPAHTTGAHRTKRRAPGPAHGRTPPARYEAHLDGLFTYCLSVLCDHAAATVVLGEVLAISERHYGRCPDGEAERKAWLYALARWACLRALSEQRRRKRQRPGAHTGRSAALSEEAAPLKPAESAESAEAAEAAESAERHRAELAELAWPEAAGTTPEQREALELAVRHQLGAGEVAAVLGMGPVAARELLASAACEVERTRAALAVVETGNCPSVARLTGDHQVLLSATLRRELVRHVDDCPRCRRAAERAGAAGPWPGSTVTPATLPLVAAPRAEAYVAMLHVPRARAAAPRFGRDGFPLDPKDHVARRNRLRAGAVTTTVVATVVAAPVLALWAAYRGAPLTGEAHEGSLFSASEADEPRGLDGDPYGHYENAGNAREEPGSRFTVGGLPRAEAAGISVEVVSAGLPPGAPSALGQAPGQGPGRLTVEAQPSGDTTMITLRASGGAPVTWSLWTDAPWLHASRTSGTLSPGESVTVHISVDHATEPAGPWTARVGVDPAGTVLRIDGRGSVPSEPPPSSEPPSEPPPSSEPPSEPPPSSEPPPATEPPPSSEPPSSQPPQSPTDPASPPASEDPAPSG